MAVCNGFWNGACDRLSAEVIALSFAGEWILAVHKAIWFPLLWATGLEAAAAEDEWFGVPEVNPAPGTRGPARRKPVVKVVAESPVRRRAA